MLLSIIIVSYNTKELLEQCLDSIVSSLANGSPTTKKIKSPRVVSNNQEVSDQVLSLANLEVIVVDNNSTDGTREYLEALTAKKERPTTKETASLLSQNQFLKVKTIFNSENAGFARANNQGIKEAKGEYVLFLNPDTIIYPNTLEETIKYLAKNKGIGLVTCRVELSNGLLQKECHRGFPSPWRSFCHFSGLERLFPKNRLFSGYFLGHLPQNTTHEIDACVGAFMMIKKEIGNKINWWDEDFFWYGEDLDLCFRLKKMGYKVIFHPKVKITHYQGASSGLKITKSKANKATKERAAQASVEAMRIFYQKHYQKKYPKSISFLVMTGISFLEKVRLFSVKRRFR